MPAVAPPPNPPPKPSTPPARGTRPIRLTTADGVSLAGLYLPHESDLVFVIAHGMTNATDKASTRVVIDRFAAHGAVVAVDFRGHGGSGGTSSVGRDETLDLDAAVRFARRHGYPRVTVIGFSLGGAVAIRHAAIGADRPDAVVTVSAPCRWYIRTTPAMRRVHWLLESPLGRWSGRWVGIRLGPPWPVVPPTPLELVSSVPPTPLLLVHGTDDRYFSPAQAIALYRAAGARAEMWIEPGMGHAESSTTADLVGRIAAWAERATTAPAHPG